MGFRIQINGEDQFETKEDHVAVEYLSVTTPRGEVARVGLAPEENVINIEVHTRSKFDGFSPMTTDVAYRELKDQEVQASQDLVEEGRRIQEEQDQKAEEEREFQASIADLSPEEQAQAWADRNSPSGSGQERGGFGPPVSGVEGQTPEGGASGADVAPAEPTPGAEPDASSEVETTAPTEGGVAGEPSQPSAEGDQSNENFATI